MGELIPPTFQVTGTATIPDGRSIIYVDDLPTRKPLHQCPDKKEFSISTFICGMLLGMAILCVVSFFFPVVHSITNEEEVFKQGIQRGAECCVNCFNRGIKSIPLQEIQNTAWTNRVAEQKVISDYDNEKTKFWKKWKGRIQ